MKIKIYFNETRVLIFLFYCAKITLQFAKNYIQKFSKLINLTYAS